MEGEIEGSGDMAHICDCAVMARDIYDTGSMGVGGKG